VVLILGFDFRGRGGVYRTSQTSPSVAVCFLDLISLMTRDWMVSDSAGKASCLSRIFWGLVGYLNVYIFIGVGGVS